MSSNICCGASTALPRGRAILAHLPGRGFSRRGLCANARAAAGANLVQRDSERHMARVRGHSCAGCTADTRQTGDAIWRAAGIVARHRRRLDGAGTEAGHVHQTETRPGVSLRCARVADGGLARSLKTYALPRDGGLRDSAPIPTRQENRHHAPVSASRPGPTRPRHGTVSASCWVGHSAVGKIASTRSSNSVSSRTAATPSSSITRSVAKAGMAANNCRMRRGGNTLLNTFYDKLRQFRWLPQLCPGPLTSRSQRPPRLRLIKCVRGYYLGKEVTHYDGFLGAVLLRSGWLRRAPFPEKRSLGRRGT